MPNDSLAFGAADSRSLDWTLVATCGFGLEAVVVRELQSLGYAPRIARPGRIEFPGDALAVCQSNVWLRSADRILVQLASFPAPDFDALFDTAREIPWEAWVDVRAALPVRGRTHRSQLASVPACQRTLKKAVVERLLEATGCGELPETEAAAPIEFTIIDDAATIDLDASGPGLHRRGYRQEPFRRSDLRETLAAALVQLSFWQGGRPLIDPFCSDGCILIEAALLGRGIAPGRRRSFAAEQWKCIPSALWRDVRREADQRAAPCLEERLIGYDRNDAALRRARLQSQAAGVDADCHFQQQAFADLQSHRKYGCVVTRPPCAPAIGDQADVEAVYRSFPEVLRRLPTWSHFILSDRTDLERLVGQSADRRRKLYHGRIACTYYQFFGPRPPRENPAARDVSSSPAPSEESPAGESSEERVPLQEATLQEPIRLVETSEQSASVQAGATTAPRRRPAAPAFGGLRIEAKRQAEEFANRLRKRARHLRRWPSKRGIHCYRLYERDIPEIPLAVDRYHDALHIAEFIRPHERTAAEHADWLDLMVRTAAEALEIEVANVFLKHRDRQRGLAQYERVDDVQAIRTVEEGGLKFEVNLSDYIDTGLFLDHRTTRSMVRDAASGARFLNLFAYTGSFTVYAAAGGAQSTVTVDLSTTYLDWAARNLQLNGFAEGEQHRLMRRDARDFLHRAPQAAFDLAVVDPPTFSNSKRADDDWDVQQHHGELLQLVRRAMAANGVVFFSTNRRRFDFDEGALPDCQVREITKQT
ncbi:MAG: bifunctional 23S rRNA (guanine(2069)-N(7))-methyltransferase RlmK/23S rRNA (guanine(2445)-N(2))-methyltransferase RlmL, partial [Planctomycetales bacterium]|nr:bifunctional 23S rRNA (guanine(2069)-N(7))-methyltransferase RlmK/23S rRNA (guanine(2445)-N(2))-methyltransferase RlmL [Planctomycetales bacterium]